MRTNMIWTNRAAVRSHKAMSNTPPISWVEAYFVWYKFDLTNDDRIMNDLLYYKKAYRISKLCRNCPQAHVYVQYVYHLKYWIFIFVTWTNTRWSKSNTSNDKTKVHGRKTSWCKQLFTKWCTTLRFPMCFVPFNFLKILLLFDINIGPP